MTAPREFGFELCLKAHSEDIKNRADIILIMVHWRLLRHSFLCVGDVHYIHSVPSELIPLNLGWNGDDNSYLVFYAYKRQMYRLAVVCQDKLLTLKLWSEKTIATVRLDTGTVMDDALVVNMQKALALCKKIDRQLIERLLMGVDDATGPNMTSTENFNLQA